MVLDVGVGLIMCLPPVEEASLLAGSPHVWGWIKRERERQQRERERKELPLFLK